MRFESIRFERVGPFEDTQIRFNPNAQLHLVHGPNEAGKSSALKQILAFLFGFEGQSKDDFLHDYRHHRVHANFVSQSKQKQAAIRKRGHKETLSGANEQDLHPSILSQGDYDKLFAIDRIRLENGSHELFSGTSELNAVLFEAMTGMPSVSEVRKRLNANKAELLKPRAGRVGELITKIQDATNCEKEELKRVANSADQAKEYRMTVETLAKVEEELILNRKEIKGLERLLRGKGLLTDLQQKEGELLQIGPLPSLTSHFEREWEKARLERTKWEGSFSSLEETLKRLANQLEDVEKPRLEIGQLTQIDNLVALKAHVESAFLDRPLFVDQSNHLRSHIKTWVAEWFPSRVNQELLAWLPEERICDQIHDAATQWENAASGHSVAKDSLEESQQILAELAQKVDNLETLEDQGLLKSVLEELSQLGYTDQSLNKMETKLNTGFEDLLARGNRLVPPVTGVIALESIACPTVAEIQGLVGQWRSLEEAEGNCSHALTSCKNDLTVKQKELERLQAGISAGANREEYERTKGLRDQTWDWIRGERKGIPSQKEAVRKLTESAGVGFDLDETMTGLIVKVDQQANALLLHSDLVSKCELLAGEIAKGEQTLRDWEADAAQHTAKREALHGDFIQRWESWHAGPTVIRDIHGLGEWFQKVAALQKELKEYRDLRQEHDAKVSEFAELGKRLSEALGETGTIQILRQKAKTKIDNRGQQEVERTKWMASRDTQLKTTTKAQRQLEKYLGQLRIAQEKWENLVGPLGDPIHEGERTGLAGWFKKIRSEEKEIKGFLDRIASMTQMLDAFLASLAEATQTLGVGAGPWDKATWQGALQILQQLATEDREKSTTLKAITAEWMQAKVRFDQTTIQRDQSHSVFAGLFQQTQCDQEKEVPDLVERIKKKTRLEQEIDRKRSQLAQDMKVSVKEYQAEMGDKKGQEMEDAIDDLERQFQGLDAKAKDLRSKRQSMEAIHTELGSSEKAAEARQQIEDLKVQLERAVGEWKLNHLSLLCLKQAIERNRRLGSQTPLARAAQFFKSMTKGRFEDIDFDEDGGKVNLKVRRAKTDQPMGITAVEGNGLSEGTACQLWLSLRLAGIEARVDQMLKEGLPPMPVVLDDVLVSFDEERTTAALEVLAKIGQKTQVILFSHHQFVSDLAEKTLGDRADLIALTRT